MTTIINGSSPSITFSDGSAQTSATRPFLNRIINGAMVIDQRNAGASVTLNSNTYMLDRYQFVQSATGKLTVQQNAGSITPPAGFNNYMGITSTSAYSVGTTEYFYFQQPIEGFNVADLNWGTANAKTVTLSFQVYSSLTGTFGGALQNSAQDRSYPFTYTISSANTWTSISITIAGDTTGTWLKTNGAGIYVIFGLGIGLTSLNGTAGAWVGSDKRSATGATSVVGTNGATFYITGVQLEVGSTATSFDYRPYGTELALCQRYFEIISSDSVAYGSFAVGFASGTSGFHMIPYKTTKRTTPTITSTAANTFLLDSGAQAGTAIAFDRMTTGITRCQVTVGSSLSGSTSLMMANNTALATISISSEL